MSSIETIVREKIDSVKTQFPGRAARVALELKKSVFNVMSHPGVSAPGEPPGVRTGNYRNSFVPESRVEGSRYISKVSSDVIYGPYLEGGTRKMSARPHVVQILDDATPRAIEIYSEPY